MRALSRAAVSLLLLAVLSSGCGPQYDGEQYVDVTVSDLDPQYDGKLICLYGDYGAGPESSAMGNLVWIDLGYRPAERIIELHRWGEYSDTVACGLLQHAATDQEGRQRRFGHLGGYEYQLLTDIIAAAPGESPYRGTLAHSGDCTRVRGAVRRDICYWRFGIAAEAVQPCGSIQDPKTRDSCYYQVAQKAHNPDLCARIRPEATRMLGGGGRPALVDLCIAQSVAEDSAPCERIVDAWLHNYCYSRVAYATGNPELCARMQRGEGLLERGDCYGDLAYKLDDLSLCEQLDEQDRDVCYWDYAGLTQQYTYCEMIVDAELRESCPVQTKPLEK